MPELHVFTNGDETAVGTDIDHAISETRKLNGLGADEYDRDEWEQLPDDQSLTINDEDEGKLVHTCAEWCVINGPGYLCGTDY